MHASDWAPPEADKGVNASGFPGRRSEGSEGQGRESIGCLTERVTAIGRWGTSRRQHRTQITLSHLTGKEGVFTHRLRMVVG